VGTDGQTDIPLPDNVRRYYIASSTHGGGAGGFGTSLPGVALPVIDPRDTHTFWFCLLRIDPSAFRASRDDICAALVAEGATASPGYIPKPVYRYPVFQNHNFFAGSWPLRTAGLTTVDYRQVSCPVAEAILADSISLRIHPAMTDEHVDQTADALAKVARHFAK